MKLDGSWKLYAGVGVALLIVALTSVFAFRGPQTVVSNQDAVTRSHAVLEGLENIVDAWKDPETDVGATPADAVRHINDEMKAEEMALLDTRATSTASSAGMVENGVLGALVVVVVVTAAVAFFRSRTVARGVGQVAAALKGISVGNLRKRVDFKSRDELRDMAATYQDMQAYLGDMP